MKRDPTLKKIWAVKFLIVSNCVNYTDSTLVNDSGSLQIVTEFGYPQIWLFREFTSFKLLLVSFLFPLANPVGYVYTYASHKIFPSTGY